MTSVRFKVQFRRQRESRLTAPPSPPCAPVVGPEAQTVTALSATPLARLLALAHHIKRLVETGDLKDQEEAAKRLNMAPSHVAHILGLLQLAPDVQEAILEGRLGTTEHALRKVCRMLNWGEQRETIAASTRRLGADVR